MRASFIAALSAAFLASAAHAQTPGPLPGPNGVYGATVNTNGGHVSFGGTPPPTANAGCGTGAVVTGADSAFRVTSGTGSNNTCALTFAFAWNAVPTCSLDVESGAAPAYRPTVSQLVLSGVADSLTYDVICIGRAGN